MSSRIATTNPGILRIASGSLPEKEVRLIMARMMQKAKNILGKKLNTDYNLNVVKYQGTPVYAFAFVSRDLINIMQGLNPDGTERIKKELDKKCKAATITSMITLKQRKEKDLNKLYHSYFGNFYDEKTIIDPKVDYKGAEFSWADFQEAEDDIIRDYEPRYTVSKQNPLWQKYYDSVHTKVEVVPANAKDPEPETKHSVLEARYVDCDITNDDIRAIFAKYDTKGQYKLNWVNNTEFVREYYPIVTRNNGTVTVQFDPNTIDAQYAIHMQRKTYIKGQELVFNFPRMSYQ